METRIEQLPALRLATLRHVGPYNQIGKTFEQLSPVVARAGLFTLPGAMMLATYGGEPDAPPGTPGARAAISIPEGTPIPEGLEEMRVEAGSYFTHTHIGGFENLGDVWTEVTDVALPASGYRNRPGPALEIYRSDMRTTPKEELRTDLMMPVR